MRKAAIDARRAAKVRRPCQLSRGWVVSASSVRVITTGWVQKRIMVVAAEAKARRDKRAAIAAREKAREDAAEAARLEKQRQERIAYGTLRGCVFFFVFCPLFSFFPFFFLFMPAPFGFMYVLLQRVVW